MLLDLGAEGDSYQSLTVSQGFASMGVGVLYDAAGDDTYAAEAGVQGSAMFGIGALIDGGGKDTYSAFTLAQGFGGAQGAGALVDVSGDDTYYCDPGDPARLSPLTLKGLNALPTGDTTGPTRRANVSSALRRSRPRLSVLSFDARGTLTCFTARSCTKLRASSQPSSLAIPTRRGSSCRSCTRNCASWRRCG